MLKSIKIQNVALVDNLEIEFSKNLNVLSGETGAGKSIIIDALNFVIGGKTLKSLIKQDCVFMLVQAVFSLPKIKEVADLLNRFDAYDNDEIIITRKMQQDGRVDTKVNGISIPANMLKSLTSYLIDIHGQHEHQKLLQDKNHLPIIDAFISNKLLKKNYLNAFEQLKEINKEINKLNLIQNQERALDLYNYQINEIESAKIKLNEDEELTQKKLLMQNSQKIFEVLNSLLENINGSNSIIDKLKKANIDISRLVKLDSTFENISERLNSCKFELLDIVSVITNKLDECEFNADEYEEIDTRLDKIKLIKKKYGATLEEVFKYLDSIKKDYASILGSKERLADLQKQKEEILLNTLNRAKELSTERQKVARIFEDQVKVQLQDLGMKNAKFVVQFSNNTYDDEKSLNENGCDNIKFMFSANIGQNLKPLSDIISGGEASRFMLALKNILADIDGMPSMVFDEIDAGISGEMGYMVACKMANISRKHQIMAVSHLPQICAMADENIQVVKRVENDKTIVETKILSNQEVLNEIARLSGGIENNAVSIEHARELKNRCLTYKQSIK